MTSFDAMNPNRLAVAKRGGWPERLDQRSQPSCGRAANPPGRVPVACFAVKARRRASFAPAFRVTAALAPRLGRLAPGSGRSTSSGRFPETVGVDFLLKFSF
jgi:hypothetical protein